MQGYCEVCDWQRAMFNTFWWQTESVFMWRVASQSARSVNIRHYYSAVLRHISPPVLSHPPSPPLNNIWSTCKTSHPCTSLDFVCRLPLSRVVLSSVWLMTTSFSCPEHRQLHWSPSVLHIQTWCLEHSVLWAASFTCVSGLFQTFTQDFSVQFIDSVFLSSRAPCVMIVINCLFFEMSVYYYYFFNYYIQQL